DGTPAVAGLTMARRRKTRSEPTADAALADAAPPIATTNVPIEAGSITVEVILALMMLLAPALGVPAEEMLQDTLKSIVVCAAALAAALVFFSRDARHRGALRWHAAIWLPLLLMAYALGSTAWSHPYLGSVEAI